MIGDKIWEIHIEPCCDAMGDAVMMNDIREGMIQDGDELFILWGDGDAMPLRYCPNCGKKVKFKEVKE